MKISIILCICMIVCQVHSNQNDVILLQSGVEAPTSLLSYLEILDYMTRYLVLNGTDAKNGLNVRFTLMMCFFTALAFDTWEYKQQSLPKYMDLFRQCSKETHENPLMVGHVFKDLFDDAVKRNMLLLRLSILCNDNVPINECRTKLQKSENSMNLTKVLIYATKEPKQVLVQVKSFLYNMVETLQMTKHDEDFAIYVITLRETERKYELSAMQMWFMYLFRTFPYNHDLIINSFYRKRNNLFSDRREDPEKPLTSRTFISINKLNEKLRIKLHNVLSNKYKLHKDNLPSKFKIRNTKGRKKVNFNRINQWFGY